MVTNVRDVIVFLLLSAIVVTLGIALTGGPQWPLWLVLLAVVIVIAAESGPEPVQHDPDMPARVLSSFDETIAYADQVCDLYERNPNSRERLGDV